MMINHRLTDLAILYIEREFTKSLNFEEIIKISMYKNMHWLKIVYSK